ncbi:hypothetical protein GGF46_001600 [Coemansia sp. RSA 552]|nr:hypothetical protein GGF46_001600 [Coemansia sp. RSA 552]
MAGISCLPRRILTEILLIVLKPLEPNMANWKAMIQLLGVCQLWTQLMKRQILSRAFIHYDAYKYVRGAVCSGWQTNVSFIADRNCCSLVRALSIHIVGATDVKSLLQELEGILQIYDINWSRVRSLTIYNKGPSPARNPELDGNFKNRIKILAQRISVKMPNVTTFCMYDSTNIINQTAFPTILLDSYIRQLHWLSVSLYEPLKIPVFDAELVQLHLVFSSHFTTKMRLPLIHSKTLRHLSLVNIPHNFSWRPFSQYWKPEDVYFESLEKIFADFIEDTGDGSCMLAVTPDQDHYVPKLYFQALRYLFINHCPPACDLLSASFAVPVLDKIALAGRPRNIEKYLGMGLESKAHQVEVYMQSSADKPDFARMANNLYSTPGDHSKRELHLHVAIDFLDVDATSWTYLNFIALNAKIDLDIILRLLARLPNLTRLWVECLGLSSMADSPDKVDRLVDQHLSAVPFELQLRFLRVFLPDADCDLSLTLAAIQSLATRMSQLWFFKVPPVLKDDVKHFIRSHCDQHLHFPDLLIL